MIGAIILALAVVLGPVSGQQGCNTKVDVTFLLDSSNNVGKDNHQKQLQFVKDTLSKLNIGPNKVQASVVTYGAGVTNQFYLNQYQNSSGVQNAITNIPFKGGSTHSPADAIRYATGTSFSPLHGGRSTAPHVAIVVTNGPSGAIDITKLEAQTARDNGVILYAVGVGSGVDQNELQAIASDPDSRHLFKAQNYDALRSLSDLLATKVCNELPPDPTAMQAPTGCLQKADLVFMIDSSSSVGSTNFQKLEHFLKSVVSKLDVAPGKVQVGMVKYGSYPSVEFSLGAYKTRPEVMKAIEGMTYLGGGTNDADAISFTGQQLFSQSNGARGNVPRIGVLITDGGSANPSAAINAANKARMEHIGLMTIGVGNRVNAHQLNSIADSRADAFQVSSYDNLDTITNQLISQMCKVNTTEPSITATAAPGATLPPDTCVDRLGNCDMYGSQVCRDYQVWAADNCKKFCGICKPLYTAGPPKCQDNLPSCSSYGKDNCKNMPTWAKSNCPLFCGFCGTNTTASGYYGQCFYKGQSYNTGDKWYDGCDYECFCEDGNSGKYKCNNRCPVYHNMPSDCTLVTQPGQCCLKSVCNFQPTVDTHTASGHGTTPDGIDVCVYKGKQYFQGQSWRDGCDYQCRCVDSKKGVYKCDDACPSFNSIPPYCHLEQKAGECCRKPVCEFSTQAGSFGGSGSISGNGVGATPTAHPPCLDVINTCSQYGKSVCTAYRGWAANNCRKYCDLCPTGLPKPGPTDQCIYAGNFYNQGDTWNTSCNTQCVCENAIYGYYRCVDTCPTYNNIPSGCRMVKNAGDCCSTLQCSNGYFLTSSPNLGSIGNGGQMNVSHPPTGMVQIRPTVTTGQALIPGTGGTGFQAPTLTGCLYKGTLYVQGQVWEDGCDYVCECSQAYSGLYTCRQKCPTYPTLQPSCVLVVDTNDACCKTPKCSPDPVTHKIPVPIPVFQAAISHHGSVQPPMHQTGGGSGQYSRTVYLVQTGLTPAPPTAPTSFVTGGIGHCTYKGVQYQQGQTWEDGCQFNCVCDDATKGHYQCVEKCVHYNNLPPDCHLEKDPANPCCDRPKCVFPVAFVTDVGQVHTTPAPRGAHCVYNGQSYSQGQTWYDGCSYQCTCEDALNNIYRCLTRCPQYTNIGANCEFAPDPKDPSCCQRPECYATGNVSFTGYCTAPAPAPSGTYVGQGIGLGYCEYKGVHYNQTDKWTDGCDFVCECTDAQTGLFRCQDKCPRYFNLPPYCTLITDFANPCCKKPQCNFASCSGQTTPAPLTGPTLAPTPLAPGATPVPGATAAPSYKYCVYKGVNYVQGQTWEDGCQYKCRCDDADQGLYTCSERCATYNPPEGCVMMTDPADSCCLVPSCLPVTQSTVAPSPGVSTPSPTPYRIPTAAPGQITGSANVPTPISGSGQPTPAPLKYCVYKSQQYAQGQKWDDGCDYTCECVDAHIGQYKCLEKCTKYVGLPSNCRLARDPASPCCQVPECSSTSYMVPTPGPTGYQSPTPAPQPNNVCVYKGVTYTQGQTWYDGCDYICDCENSGTGLYRCNNRCPTYNIAALPKECHMESSSKDPLCCKEPKCSFVPYTNQTTGFVPVPTPPPGVIDGGVATPTPAPTLKPSPGYQPTPAATGTPGVCVYKGNQYQQGQKWQDGCVYNCECLDALAGHYRCTEMCPKYEELPPGCRLISDYNNPCCKKAYCDISKVPTPAPFGISTPAPSPGSKSGCVYNGVTFAQGQQWNDGCDLQCVCEDETTGFYRCTDRCSKYNPPEYCTLVTDPRDSCCKVPSCPSVTPTPRPWVPGMVPTPAPGVTFSPNRIPTPGPGLTYAPGMYPTWVPGMVPTPAPGMTFAPYKIPTPGPGLTYAPGMYPIWVPGMVPTPAPGMTYAPNKIPTPAPGSTYAPGMYPTWVPGMVPTPAPGMTFAPNKIPTPAPGQTYAPGLYPTWVPGMVPTPAPGKTFAPNKIPTPGPGRTYAPGMYPTWVPGMVPTPAPGMTFAPNKVPTPAPGITYPPGMFPTWVPGMVPTPAPGKTFAPNKIPTPAPGSTYAPGMYPTWVPGMVPTPAPGMTFAPNKIPTPGPGKTYAPGMYPTWVPGMIPTPAPGFTYAPNKIPTPAPGSTYAPGMYPTWVPGMEPTPAPGYTYPPYLIPTPAPGKTYAPGKFPVPSTTVYPTPAPGQTYPPYVPGMIPTPAPGKTYAPNLIPTPAPGSTYAPGKFPTWVPGMVPTIRPGVTVPWWLIPTPAPGTTYAPFHIPTWVPGMIPTPAPGYTFAPNKVPTPAPGQTYAPGLYPTWVPGMVPTPAPGMTYAPNKVPTPAPGQTFAPGMFPTWVPGMVPTPAPGFTFAPNKVPTPAPGQTYAPGMFPTWAPGMVPTPAPGMTYAPDKVPTPEPGKTYAPGMYPTWVPGMAPTPAPGKTFAPNKIPTPAPGSTYAPGKFPTFIPGFMVPTPAPGFTFGPNKVPTPGPGQTYAPGMIPTWVPGMVPTPAPGMTYAPNKIPTPAPGKTYAPGMYPTWVPGMAPTPAPGKTFAPNKIPTPAPGSTYAPGKFPTFIPGFMVPTPAPGFTFGPNKVPTPGPGQTYAPGMIPTWVPGMVPTPAPGMTYAPNKIPTPAPGQTYAPGMYPTWVPGMAPTPAPGKTFAPNKIPTPAPGSTYAPGKFPTFIPGFMVPTPAPGFTFGPNKVPTPGPGQTYAPGMIPTWVPGMVPTPAPGYTYPPYLIPTPAPGKTYAPGQFPKLTTTAYPTPAPGQTYPPYVPGMIPTPAPGKTYAPDLIPTPAPGSTYAPGKFPTWVPGMVPTVRPGVTVPWWLIPTPAPGSTYPPFHYPAWVPGMIPTPAPGVTYAPDKVPTPAPGSTYAPGLYPTWVPGMVPTPAPGKTFAPNKIPTPGPGRTYAPGMYPTFIPGLMVPTPAPGVTYAPNKIPTPGPGLTYAPGMYPTWVPGMVPTPAPGMTYAPDKVPTPEPGRTYAPGLYPTWVPGMVPTPAPGKTFAPNKIPTPGPGRTYAPGMFPTYIPGLMVPTPAPGVTYAPNKIPTPWPGHTYAPGMYPTWVPGMVPTPAPGMTYAPNKLPTPEPGRTYAPGMYPTWVPGMVPTPAPGKTFAPNKLPTPAPGSTYAPGMFPTFIPGLMVPTPAPGVTFGPNKVPTPGPGLTYAPGMYPTWVPGMVPTPAPGETYAPNKIPTPEPGKTYAPGMFPTWLPGMVPTPFPGKTFAPNKLPTPAPGSTYAPGMFPTFVPGLMVPTPAPGVTYGPDKVPTPSLGSTYAPGMYPTWVPGMIPTPAPGMTYAPNKVPTPAPGSTYAPGMYPTWVPGMVPTPAPGMTYAPNKVPTPAPGSTYAPGMFPTWVPGMVPTPAPGKTYAPDRIPTPAPGSTYAPGMYPTWVPGMVPTPAPGMTFAPNKIPTPGPYGTYAPGMYPTWVPGMIPTPAPGVTYAPNKVPTPAPGSTYAPGMYPTWVPGMVPTPAPGYTYPPYLIPTPAPGKTYAPGQFPVPTTTQYPTPAPGQTYPPYKPGMIPTPAPGKTYAPGLIPTPAPGSTYAPGKFPTWVPGMVPTIRPGVTVPWWLIPTPAPGSTYPPFHYPTWVPGMIPTPAPGVTYAPDKVPTPGPGKTYAPGLYPTWVPGMVPTPAPGKTFAPNKLPTPGPGLTYAPGMYPTFIPGLMVPTPAPGVTYGPNKVPTPGPGLTYAPGMYPTWVPGMVPTPAPGMTYAPNKIPTPYPGRTYAPGMYPTWVPGMVPTPAPGVTYAPNKIPTPGPGRTYAPGMYPTWVPGMVPTPAPGKTFAPNKLPTPGPGLTYAPGMYPTFIPGLMVPTPAPGVTYAPNKVPTPGPGLTYAPGMYPTWVPGMVPTPAPGMTYAPNKIPTPAPGQTYAPGMYPTWVPGMVPTPAPGMTYAPNKIPTPQPGQTYAPGMYPTWVPGMVPTPAPGYTFAPNKIPTPGPGQTYAPGMYPTWVPGMVPTPAPGMTFAPDKIPTMLPGVTYPPGMYPTWVPGMVPTPAPGKTYAPGKIPTPAPGQTYAPGMFPVITPSPAPQPTPYAIPTAIPGVKEGNAVSPNKSVSGCMYHGIVYGQSQKWRDGCQYDCECIDEHTGRFRCKERCPLYLNVPSYCRLIVDPNDSCCKKPVCQTVSPAPQPTQFKIPTAQPKPGSSPLSPTPGPQPTPQPSNVCVMNGKEYVAGQTWYNGCAQQCVCEDGTTGFYRCYDRCKTYTNVPAGCTMVADPKDPTCCEVPQCIPIPGPGVTITPGPPIVVTGVTGVITGTNPPTSFPPTGPTPTPRNVCIYGGRTYQQGQKWQDGCKYDCVCEDGITGRYRCTERCATVPFLPPQCKMQRDPKDVCCFVAVCDYNQTVPTLPSIPGPQPSPGVSTQTPNTLPPSFCVYNGAPFFKGQTWDDGCTKKCRCDDADQNIITCFDRCTTYNNIGANCVMVSDPQDSCCQIPKCPTPPTGSITGGPQPNPITGVVPNQGYCEYKGVHYKKGQTWDDGCTYTCLCIDDMSGQWQCDEKCPRYVQQIPANCQMVQDPANKCCRKPYCPAPTAAPTPGPSGVPTPAPRGVCVMNGQTYTQGQKWFDGCDQTCICNDGKTGAYSCTDRCPTYSPQPGCTMVADPRDPICCLAPQCPGVNITGVTGGITGYGTPPTPTGGATLSGNFCVYKGKSYSSGQRWQDGCQYDCECINANIGQYKCTDRCPRYPNLPASCHLEYDPSNPCCQKPVCQGQTPTPGTGVTPTPSTDVCIYQGVVFRQGQSINQGCDRVCVCEDGKTGRITCHERCKTYPPLAANCTLVTDPNDQCCQVPSCVNPNTQNPNQIVTGVTGTITGTRLPDNNPYTGGTRNVCVYKGQSYSQGQTWDDGCTYTCECLDSNNGLYKCTEKCPSYPTLPSYCTLVQDTVNKCCQKPYCTPLIAPTPMPSPGGVTPTPGPSTKVCVYQGYTYAQGQQWYDGCSANCRCEDADKNLYRCQQRCSVYNNVAPGCTMVPDPSDPDCCEIPDCPIVPPVNPTPGIVTFKPGPGGVVTGIGLVPTPGPGVSPSPGYRKGCLYKGMVFQKGQKFDDGCDYECECLDDSTGRYRCVEKCTKYTVLPKQCVLIQDPNKLCCQVPYCDYTNPTPFPNGIPTPGPGKVPTPAPGVITVAPYVVPSFTAVSGPSPTPGKQGYCVYKGVYYTQGQTWDDGCSKKCRCEDVNSGYYSCAQRCHTYSNTPGNCVLRADPNDACCLVPDCNQIPTPKPAPTGTLPPGVSTTPAPIIVPASISGSFTGIGTLPGSSVTGSNGACVYKGVSYKQGQKWQDACTYNCECIDAQRGQYRCTNRCPQYVYLPSPQCYLKPSPTDSCCKVAECSTVMRPTTKAPVTPSPSPTVLVTVPTATECVYLNGQKYAKGATWTDGCSTCECKDPAGNQFICTNKCPAYSGLPSFCTLVQDPSDACCMKPQCNLPGVSLTPYIGGGTSGSATPPTSLQVLPVGTHQTIIGYGPPTSGSGTRNACVYQGTSHSQGQSWEDACKYVCTCEDASTGRYKCLSKCPAYPSLPSYCRKISVPGQCCPTVTCDIPGYGTYTPVPQLTPGPVPTIQPGMSTPNPQIILVPSQGGSTTGTGYPGGGYYLPNATNSQVIGTLRDKCVYKNQLYNQGDKWDDGCDYKCECLDSRTGYFQCSPLCPIYNNLPSNQCYLVKAQGQCCSQPMCYDPSVGKAVNPLTSNSVFPVVGTFSGGFTGFRPGYPYSGSGTSGGSNVCVYKGTVYHQGDKWNDGCDFSCECIDQKTGMYRCNAKCPTYTKIPPLCTFVTDPADQCCKKINCQPTGVSLPPGYSTVTPAPSLSPQTSGNCTDLLSDCDQYGQAVCTSSTYRTWADRNCRAYCGFCPSTGSSGNQCQDKLNNCASYGQTICTSAVYRPWAQDNCKDYCGFCPNTGVITGTPSPSPADTCVDKFSGCAGLGQFYCSDIYKVPSSYSWQNCRKYCGWCHETITTPTPTPTSVYTGPTQGPQGTTKPPVCSYKGKTYTQGQHWQDACQYNCSCDDASIGYYRCRNLCPDYQQLPPDCKLVTVQGQCCPRLDCTISVGVSPNPPVIISANKYCSYKGHFYRQDETWNDGCSQTCTCTNATRGFYSCGSVCLNWDNLPAICHLEDAPPGKCCRQPQCPSGVIINIPTSYKDEYPKSVNPNYNYV